MPLYKINAQGAKHRRRENGKPVIYRANPRTEGERGEIELTAQQAASPKFRHLGLVAIVRGNVETAGRAPANPKGDADLQAQAQALLDRETEMSSADFRKEAGKLLGAEFSKKGDAGDALRLAARPTE